MEFDIKSYFLQNWREIKENPQLSGVFEHVPTHKLLWLKDFMLHMQSVETFVKWESFIFGYALSWLCSSWTSCGITLLPSDANWARCYFLAPNLL